MSLLFVFFLMMSFNNPSAKLLAETTENPTLCQFYLLKSKGIRNEKSLQNISEDFNIKTFYVEKGEMGKESFERMVKSGVQCDGLVLSGHHVGDFLDSKKKLFLKDMEKLSCNPKYKKWFRNIKSLWLLGCNTATDKYLEPIRKGERDNPNKNVNSETARLLDSSYNSNNIFLFQHSYTASIDELAPLSSRYLRMFPETKIYGFHNASPSEKQEKDSLLIYKHVKNLASTLHSQDSSQFPLPSNKQAISQALNLLLKSHDYCDEKLESWDKQAHPNARAVENQDYTDVQKLGCKLTQAKQILEDPKSAPNEKEKARETILNTLKRINRLDKEVLEIIDGKTEQNNEIKYSHLLFNNIYETWMFARKEDKKLYNGLRKVFKEDVFSETLKERIQSPTVASVRQIDYLNFYKEIHSIDPINSKGKKKKLKFVQDQLSKIMEKLQSNFKGLRNVRTGEPISYSSRQVLSLSTIDQLSQYELLSKKQTSALLKNKTLFPKGTQDTYTLQMRYKLQHKFDTPTEFMKKITKNLNSHQVSYSKKAIPISLATKDYFRSNDLKKLSQLVGTINKESREAKKAIDQNIDTEKERAKKIHTEMKKLKVQILNDTKTLLVTEHPDQPKKQSRILLNYMKTKKLKLYALEAVLDLSPQTQKEFFSQISVNDIPKDAYKTRIPIYTEKINTYNSQ